MEGGDIVDRQSMANNLRELRLKKGLTQAETAKIFGVSPAAWGMYETGKRIPRDELKVQISKYFNRTVQTIFFK